MLTLPAALLLVLVSFLRLHGLDQTLAEGGQTPSSGGRRTDVHLDPFDAGTQDGLARLSSDAVFERVFGPLHDEGSPLVGTCMPEDEPAVDHASDGLLEAQASALLRCTLWTGIEAGGGGADDLEARVLEPVAFDPATDFDGTQLLGLGPRSESQNADIAGLMPWWTLAGPGASLPTGADGDRAGMSGGFGGGTGGGSAGVGGGGGGAAGPTRGSRTSADDDVVRGGDPETPSDDSGDGGSDPLNALDTEGQDDGDDHDPADGSPDPHDGGSTPIDIFPPRIIVPPVTGGPGGGPGGQPGGGATQLQSVPEPATFLLAGAGLAALMIRRRPRV